ncbi:MAG: acyl carrier protein [Bacteroidales bacterium]|nr:acyl carrier protein [Bacteroidales bacterium]
MKEEIIEIACSILGNEINSDINERKLLHLIISESNKALEFVTLIEDEFGIEFNDEDIDLDFFLSIDTIIKRINKALMNFHKGS